MFRIAVVALVMAASCGVVAPVAHAQTCGPGSYFRAATQVAAGNYAIWTAINDFDGDGNLDIAVANFNDNAVRLLVGRGDGTFSIGPSIPVPSGPRSLVAADMDRDGRLDLVVATLNNSSVVVLRNQGSLSFASVGSFSVASPPRGIAVDDFDRDGIPDIAAGTENGLSILRGRGTGGVWDGTFNAVQRVISPWLWSIRTADIDGDGFVDVVGAANATSVEIFYNSVSGFISNTELAVGAAQADVAITDLNGDGRLDIALSANNFTELLNQGARQFQSRTYTASGLFNGIATGDINHDGHPDIVGTIASTGALVLFVGYGDGTFVSGEYYTVGQGPVGVAVADLNHDAGIDAVVANTSTNNVSVLLASCHGPVPPLITSIVPTAGAPGDSVAILGASLLGTTSVTFNGTAASFAVVNDGKVLTAVPEGATTGPITLQTGLGTAVSPTSFSVGPRPVVSQAIPDHAKRGASVQLRGLNLTGATKVQFGTGGPAPFQILADTALNVVVDNSATTGQISVTNAFSVGKSAFTFTVVPLDTVPHIVSVRDVPNDQGGKVFIGWLGSDVDLPGKRYITGYRVWRRMPPAAEARAGRADVLTRTAPDGVTLEFWEALVTLPAAGLPGYAYAAATTQDSLPDGNPLTAFFVQALTTDAFVWFNSTPDSGYSVDNLAPPQPQPFVANYGPASVALHWAVSPATDFAAYRLYRGPDVAFVPGPANLIATVLDTGYVDPGRHDSSVYKLAVVDIHGNESHFATVTPNGPTGILIALASADASDGAVHLRWYAVGNGGLQARLERSVDGAPWAPLGILTADGAGMLSYLDRDVAPGVSYGYHLIALDGDRETTYGETWVVVTPPGLRLRVQNPVVSSGIDLDVTLADGGPARLDVLDVAGRMLLSRGLEGWPAGLHHVHLDGVARAPGMLLVRLTQSGRTVVARAASLR